MEIKYLGHASFRIKGKTGIIVTDPFEAKMVGLKFPKDILANAVTISHHHKDHDRVELVGGSPVVISGPGEYEVSQIKIFGYPTFHDEESGKKRGRNTIYLFKVDGISILHLGDLGHKLSDELIDEIGSVDILLLPIGGVYTLGIKEAVEVARQIEPRVIIPMHFKKEGLSESFKDLSTTAEFLKEMGKEGETLSRLSISAEKLPSETAVVVLE